MREVVVLLVGVSVLAGTLHWAQAFTGALRLMPPAADYGRADFSTGAAAYPRTAYDAQARTVTVLRPAKRVASLYWSVDEFVYSIVPPENVVAVSTSAYDRKISNVYAWAERFQPEVGANAEAILKQNPDLAIMNSEGRADFTDILDLAGVPTFRMFIMFTTLDAVADSILLTGYLSGDDARAREVHDDFQEIVRVARSRKPTGVAPPRILGYAGRYSYGDQTLFHDIVHAVGGINVGAENGLRGYDAISTEQVVRWNPDWIVSGAAQGTAENVLQRILELPGIELTTAAQKKQILVFENHVFLPMSPFTALMLDALSQELYAR